jgi:hypothetical protein
MSTISGMNKMSTLLPEELLTKLDKSAERHFNQSNITFNILKAETNSLEVEVTQGETKSGKYASEATLISRTRQVFDKFFPQQQIQVFPNTFLPSPAAVVNPEWIEKKMLQKGVRIKQIAFETGIDRESISDWVTGKRSMSQIVKAMFYFYLSR